MMFTDHECAVEEAHFLQETHEKEVVIATNESAENLWVLSRKQMNQKQYSQMNVLETFTPRITGEPYDKSKNHHEADDAKTKKR